jgi:hypothetical protein
VTPRVWYAAYGSNLSRERFDFYLRGGQPDGTSHRYPGCRSDAPPEADVADEIAAELCFGGWSQTWGGGVAFVRTSPGAKAKARLYLVTLDQFSDVVAQENWLVPGTISIEPTEQQIVLDGEHTYRVVIPLGMRDGTPVLTVSQLAATDIAAPTTPYLRYIAEGLRTSHGLSTDEIVAYLASAPGGLSPEDVAGAVS